MLDPFAATFHPNLSPDAPDPAPLEPPALTQVGPVERRKRLSESVIWEVERRFYAEQGINAWGKTGIPYYVTSNPYIARAYARVVLGFMRDCLASNGGGEGPSDPLEIVELGAGHGRFAYLFLTQLLALRGRASLARFPFRYIMTDFAERNIEHWLAHPKLQPFVDAGLLDFARYDIGTDRELRLVRSGDSISPERPRGHVAVIANYVFDSLPQDVFYVKNGSLHETLITLALKRGDADLNDPSALSRATVSYEQSPAREGYYDDPAWNEILSEYRERLAECSFHFPTTALACIRDLRSLGRGSFLLLSADKGYSDEEALLGGAGEPILTPHSPGCFSGMVNYHAIGRYVSKQGGEALHPGHGHESLNISAFTAGHPPRPFLETADAYEQAIEAFGPDDMFTVSASIDRHYESMSLTQLLAHLRMVGFDSHVFLRCAPLLGAQLAHAGEAQKRELARAIQHVWEAHYPVGDDLDLAFQLGGVLYALQYLPEALDFFHRSIELHGPTPGSLYNIGLCHYGLRQIDAALPWFHQALEMDPSCEPARAMRLRAEASTARSAGK